MSLEARTALDTRMFILEPRQSEFQDMYALSVREGGTHLI
jgi:hypothetical protein